MYKRTLKAPFMNKAKRFNPPKIAEENEDENENVNNINKQPTVNEGGDDEFPASQQTQMSQRRYFSQRSNFNRSQNTTTQSNSTTSGSRKVPHSFVENTLLRCGVTMDDSQYFVLSSDHITFVNKLRNMLTSSPDYPANVDKFVQGLKTFIKDETQLIKMLSVCMMNVQSSEFLPKSQECLMKNFLMIDFLETHLITILLDRLQELTLEPNPTDQHICSMILVLNQLGFVNKIANADLIYTKISEILDNCIEVYRTEIIKHLKDILDPKQHDQIAQKLLDILGDNLINEITVDSFESMHLSSSLQRDLKLKFLYFLREKESIKIMPTLIKFLLKFNSKDLTEFPDLIAKIRSSSFRDFEPNQSNVKEISEIQTKVFEYIVRALKRSKELSDIWLKSIQHSDSVNTHYPMDILVLIVMSTVNEDRTFYLENVIRRKIKLGLITPELFKKAIRQFPEVISNHLKVFFEFIDNLFKDKGELSEFGEIGYKLAFGLRNCDHKLLLSKLVAFVCEKNSQDVISRALILLSSINKEFPSQMQTNSLQILRILDKVSEVGLYEYRIIMDLLSSIAYPSDALPVDEIASHIDMMVRKQVTSSVLSVKLQGIVGSVRVIDHLVWHSNNELLSSLESDMSIEDIAELANENSKNAANLVNLMFLSAKGSPDTLALCYDELSSIFTPRVLNLHPNKRLDKSFVNWLCHYITDDFQNLFVVNEIPADCVLEQDRKFCINQREEYGEENTEVMYIAVNIGGLVFAKDQGSSALHKSDLLMLCPVFGLMRILNFHRYNGDLENINAMVGCPIIFPKFVNSPEDLELFDERENEKNQMLLDALFYTANWFREVICAFSGQTELNIRQKVLQRLNDVIRLEDNIRNLLKVLPGDYKPPKSQFMSTLDAVGVLDTFKKPRPVAKSKQKKNTSAVQPDNTVSRTQNQTLGNITQNTSSKTTNSAFLNSYGPKEIYRQLDPDVMHLLKEPLCTLYPMPTEKVGTCLGLPEFKFIIEDLILKLESVTGVKKLTPNQVVQFIICPVALIYDIKQFLPRFMQFFNQILDAMDKIASQGKESGKSALLSADEINFLKTCFGLTLRLWSGMFSWSGMRQEAHQGLLQKTLYGLVHPQNENLISAEVQVLATTVLDWTLDLEHRVLDLKSAVYLAHLADSLAKISNQKDRVVELHIKLISRHWTTGSTGAVEKGSEANVLLEDLLKGLFANADLKFVQKYLLTVSLEVGSLNNKDGKLKSFPNFTKLNFALLFRALFVAMLEQFNRKIESDLTTLMKLELWEKTIECLNLFLDVVKTVNIQRNFNLFLRYSHLTIKQFLQHGIPLVEIALKSRPERVTSLVKGLQQTTRFLHNLCCQYKAIKNAGIVAQIPALRASVESLIYRVKAALAANNCQAGFWMGNLKNKDLHGEEILSQVPSLSNDGNDSESEDELPTDDETLDGNSLASSKRNRPSTSRMDL